MASTRADYPRVHAWSFDGGSGVGLDVERVPWTFGVSQPEVFLAEHGWRGEWISPGEPQANYGPLAVSGRTAQHAGASTDLSGYGSAGLVTASVLVQPRTYLLNQSIVRCHA